MKEERARLGESAKQSDRKPASDKVSKTLEQARQNVKSIVKKEQQNEVVTEEMMAFRLK